MAKPPTFKDYLIADTGLVRKTAYDPEQHKVPSKDEVRLCINFIETCITKTPKFSSSKTADNDSYHLKNATESWFDQYVSNGAFILAAKRLGFRMEPEAPNARFNMEKQASIESCRKFWAWHIAQYAIDAHVKSFDSKSKQHLWNEYRHFCKEKLNRCPPVRKIEFWLFLDKPEI
jgi:hypothetical protein